MKQKRDDIATITAKLHGLTPRYVRMVVKEGTRTNEAVFNTYMDLKEGKTALVEAVEKLIPLDNESIKGTKMPSNRTPLVPKKGPINHPKSLFE